MRLKTHPWKRHCNFPLADLKAVLLFRFLLFIVLGFSGVIGKASEKSCRNSSIRVSSLALGPSQYRMKFSNAKKIRQESDTFYTSALQFTNELGKDFSKMVFDHVPRDQRTTIVIAMGGAEHLGTLLELYAGKNGISNVDFHYLHLNTKMMKSWSAYNENWTRRMSGFGSIPVGFKQNGYVQDNLDVISDYLLSQMGLFENPNVLVVDTGYSGTTVEAVAATVRLHSMNNSVEGALISKSEMVHNTVPVHTLANQNWWTASKNPTLSESRWASAIDCNNCQGAQVAWALNAFQRSEHFSEFYQDDRGKWVVETVNQLEETQKKLNYDSTLFGLFDGL